MGVRRDIYPRLDICLVNVFLRTRLTRLAIHNIHIAPEVIALDCDTLYV